MPDPAPAKPRWMNPADDAGFAESFLKGAQGAKPVPPLTDAEKERLRDLMLVAAEQGDRATLTRLQSYAGNPLGFREAVAGFAPPPA